MRKALDADEIAFRINDHDGKLLSQFPVFDSWTRFKENELVD